MLKNINHTQNSANQADESFKLSLDNVLDEMERWRANKDPHKPTSIPDELWHKIFMLAKQYPPSKIRVLFGISNQQYQRKFKQLFPKEIYPEFSEVDLCEVNTPSVVSPHDIPATNTVIVEFIRKDGQIMRIHTTTHHFQKLIQAFFEGGLDAASHFKA